MRDIDDLEPSAPSLVDVVRVHEHVAIVLDRIWIGRKHPSTRGHWLARSEDGFEFWVFASRLNNSDCDGSMGQVSSE